jgi:hypothetical protein
VLLGSLHKILEHAQHTLEHMQQRWTASRRGSAAGGAVALAASSASSLHRGGGGGGGSHHGAQMGRRTVEAVDTMLERAQQLAGKGVEQVGAAPGPRRLLCGQALWEEGGRERRCCARHRRRARLHAGCSASARGRGPTRPPPALPPPACPQVCAFLAARVVFWDMRLQWLELVYRHRAANARLDPLLGELNDSLAEICGAMSHPDLAPQFARVRQRRSRVAECLACKAVVLEAMGRALCWPCRPAALAASAPDLPPACHRPRRRCCTPRPRPSCACCWTAAPAASSSPPTSCTWRATCGGCASSSTRTATEWTATPSTPSSRRSCR